MVEAKTNKDRRIRLVIILVMFFGMGGWFAYDGWVKYPSANLRWALENLPVKPEAPQINTKVMTARAESLQDKVGMSVKDIIAVLGEPTMALPRELKFVGEELTIIIHVEEGEVKDVSSNKVDSLDRINADPRVREESLEKIQPGMTVEDLERRLGKPYHNEPPTLWFIGPAAFVKVAVDDDNAASRIEVHENNERTEGDIQLQKIIALGLFAIGTWFLIKTVREFTLRIIADPAGISLGGRRLAWDQVTGMDTSIYEDKGWLDLKYQAAGGEKSFRLDSYYLTNFDALMSEIARHKGWTWPLKPSESVEGGAFPVVSPEDRDSPSADHERNPADQA